MIPKEKRTLIEVRSHNGEEASTGFRGLSRRVPSDSNCDLIAEKRQQSSQAAETASFSTT
jgi:hypothetical protein